MAFLSTPEVLWLYSGVTITNPSSEAIFAAHFFVWSFWYWPSDGGSGSSKRGHGQAHPPARPKRRAPRRGDAPQADQLDLRTPALGCDLVHPLGYLCAVAVGAGAAEDDTDPSHGGPLEGSSCCDKQSDRRLLCQVLRWWA